VVVGFGSSKTKIPYSGKSTETAVCCRIKG